MRSQRNRRNRMAVLAWTLSASAVAVATAGPAFGAGASMDRKTSPTYGIADAALPLPGILTAGQPTGEQLQLLAEDGYHAVIDLRPPGEPHGFDEPEAARENGLAYLNLPVDAATLDQATLDRFLGFLRRIQRPLLIHGGTSGPAGALLYAWLVLEKREAPAKALETARAAGLRSPELIDKVRRLVAERRATP
jgi:protein tyrosine phosphatase (PTP) superfamily phosphohydrolase (DUF442 family)